MVYDTIIVGGGPGGITASIYAQRAGLNNIMIEKLFVGGQVANTYEIENYTGHHGLSGPELIGKFEEHLKSQEVNVVYDEIIDIDVEKRPFVLKGKKETYETKTVIISTGAKPSRLNVSGEDEYAGKGVSYCATCDGAFFRNKTVAVLGSGNTAVEDALFLSKICKKVYSVTRSDYFKADKKIFESLQDKENVEIVYNYQAKEIKGEDFVNKIILKHKSEDKDIELDVDGVFVAVGVNPASNLLEGKVKTDQRGYIETDAKMNTSVEGIFAIGDARNTLLRQVITAAADGAVASYFASIFVLENK